ncbi:MAG TPA: hypothetical protein PLJ26_01140, partial [Candidatus Omnitrophota bacterium]|nr:hypothetical protein [Candidatus Omnitrophota bacterium]
EKRKARQEARESARRAREGAKRKLDEALQERADKRRKCMDNRRARIEEKRKARQEARESARRAREEAKRAQMEQRVLEKAARKKAVVRSDGSARRADMTADKKSQETDLQKELDACRRSLALMEHEMSSQERQSLQDRIDRLLEKQRNLLDASRKVEQGLLEQKKNVEIMLEQARVSAIHGEKK